MAASLLTAISIILTRVLSFIIPIGGVGALRIGFGSIPTMISGILFGPLVGGLTGVTADLVGTMINPMGGPFFPGFTISAALTGIIPGIFFRYVFNNKTAKSKVNSLNYSIINALVVILLSALSAFIYVSAGNSIDIKFILIYFIAIIGFIVIPIVLDKRYKKENTPYRFDQLIFVVSIRTIIVSLVLNTLWLTMLYDLGVVALLPIRILTALITIPLDTVIVYILSKYFKYAK